MNKNYLILIIIAIGLISCKISYTFTGASIPPEAKTVSIKYFPNHAPLVQPTLSNDLTETLKDRFVSQTSLQLLSDDIGDLHFEGKITDYRISPQAIQGDQLAATNRLTVSIQVKFTNDFDPDKNFDKSFSRYADYEATTNIDAVESELNMQIVEELVDDIFNAAVANW